MLTFFTAAKPFRGATAVHQRNALRSWLAAAPGSEVLLFGDEEGSAEAAAELGVRRIACEAGLRMAGVDAAALAPGVEVAGIATFLEALGGGQIITL